jgi:hypothetical protein
MNMKKFLILCSFSILLFSSVYGKVNISQNDSWSSRPSVAVNKDGVVLVVWVENDREYESGPFYYRVKKEGEWSAVKKVGIIAKTGWTPLLDVDANGIFHLTYSDGFSVYDREVYYCAYDPDSGWQSPEMIYLSPHNSAWPKIDIEGDRIHIGWTHRNTSPYIGGDIVMISKKMGEKNWPNNYERISWSANNISGHIAFKVKNDKIFASYMEGTADHGPWRLLYKEAPRGSSWQTVPVEGPLYPNAYYPELEIDDNDDIHVIWGNREGNMPYRTKVGNTWKANEIISNMYTPRQMPDLRYKNSMLVAAFTQSTADSGIDLFYASKVIGGNWETPAKVAEGAEASHPRVWIDDNAFAHFVWEEKGGVGGKRDISYERIAVGTSDPFLGVSPQTLSFTVEGVNPDPTSIFVKNIGKESLDYKITVDQDWVSVTPTSGTLKKEEEDELQCLVDAVGLEEGTHNATIEVSSKEAINSPRYVNILLEVLAPPIYPPDNFTGQVLENKALFYREHIHELTWEANSLNRDIEKYVIYEIDGVNAYFLAEIPATTFEYTRRHTTKGKTYTYELWAVDEKGRTGNDPATVTLGGTSAMENKEKDSRTSSIKSYIIK